MSELERFVERLVAERDGAEEQARLAHERLAEVDHELKDFGRADSAYYGLVRLTEIDGSWRYETSDGFARCSGMRPDVNEALSLALAELHRQLPRNIEKGWRLRR